LIDGIQNLDDLGWHEEIKKRRVGNKQKTILHYYPSRRAGDTTGIFENISEKKVAIRYLGWRWRHAGDHLLVGSTRFQKLGDHDGKRLHAFLNYLRGMGEKDLQVKVEELFIQKMWDTVRARQEQIPETSPDPDPEPDPVVPIKCTRVLRPHRCGW